MHWRPAKAFLLDERSAFLREIILDASCTISFQDVLSSGALTAPEPVRIGRLFAQVVRGDGLALVVLAAGQAEPTHVDFVRQVLAGVRASFEPRVLDRLELARAEEARIEMERQRLATEAADVAARQGGVASLNASVTAAHERLAAEVAALNGRYEAIAAGEAVLAERALAVDNQRAEIESVRADLESRAQGAGERAAESARREAAILEIQAALDAREKEIARRETESESFLEELSVKVAQNAKWEKRLRAMAADLERRAEALGVDPDIVPHRDPESVRGASRKP